MTPGIGQPKAYPRADAKPNDDKIQSIPNGALAGAKPADASTFFWETAQVAAQTLLPLPGVWRAADLGGALKKALSSSPQKTLFQTFDEKMADYRLYRDGDVSRAEAALAELEMLTKTIFASSPAGFEDQAGRLLRIRDFYRERIEFGKDQASAGASVQDGAEWEAQASGVNAALQDTVVAWRRELFAPDSWNFEAPTFDKVRALLALDRSAGNFDALYKDLARWSQKLDAAAQRSDPALLAQYSFLYGELASLHLGGETVHLNYQAGEQAFRPESVQTISVFGVGQTVKEFGVETVDAATLRALRDDLKTKIADAAGLTDPAQRSQLAEALDALTAGLRTGERSDVPGQVARWCEALRALSVPFAEQAAPDENLAALLKAKGIAMPPGKDGARDFVAYAFAHFSEWRPEIEASFGKLPFQSDGSLDAAYREGMEVLARGLEEKFAALGAGLEKQGMIKGSPEYDAALIAASPEEYALLKSSRSVLAPLSANEAALGAPSQDRVLDFFLTKIHYYRHQAQNPETPGLAVESSEKLGMAYVKVAALSGEALHLKAAAEAYLQAAQWSAEAGASGSAESYGRKAAALLQSVLPRLTENGIFPRRVALEGMGMALRFAGRNEDVLAAYRLALSASPDSPSLKKTTAALDALTSARTQLGASFFADLKKGLEAKGAERKKAETLERGLRLLDGLAFLPFPRKADGSEAPLLAAARKDLIDALKAGDAARIDSVSGKISTLVAATQDIASVEAIRGRVLDALGSQAPYLKKQVEDTGDWSLLRSDFSGLRLPADWNAETLNALPLWEALRGLPAADRQTIEAALDLLQKPLLSDAALADSAVLEAELGYLLPQFYETDPASGQLRNDPVTGNRELKGAWGRWMAADRDLGLAKNPAFAVAAGFGRGKKNLTEISGLLAEIKTLGEKLRLAQTSGDAGRLQEVRDEIAGKIGDYQKYVAASSEAFREDEGSYRDAATELGILEHVTGADTASETGTVPYEQELGVATYDSLLLLDGLAHLDAQDPASLKILERDLQILAGAHGTLLKAWALSDAALSQNALPFDGCTASVGALNGGAVIWTVDEKWEAKKREVEAAFGLPAFSETNVDAEIDRLRLESGDGFVFHLDGAGIAALLAEADGFLQSNDSAQFKNPEDLLKAGIAGQIEMWDSVKETLSERGENTRDVERLLGYYRDARRAFDLGDTDKARALFQLAYDSARSDTALSAYKWSNWKDFGKTLALEVAIVGAATLISGGILGVMAPGAVASVGAGTATWKVSAAVTFANAGLFWGTDKAIRTGLSAHGIVEPPWHSAHGAYDGWDAGFEIVELASMFGVLGKGMKMFRGATLGSRVLADPAAQVLLADAKVMGAAYERGLMTRLMEGELSKMGTFGRAGYRAMEFGAEAAIFQGWSNVAAFREVGYQNLRGADLDLGDRIGEANSGSSILQGIAFLAGLKLGHLVTGPVHKLAQAPVMEAAARRQVEIFQKTAESFLTRAQESKLRLDASSREAALRLVAMGDALFLSEGTQLGNLPRADWKELRGYLKTSALLGERPECAGDAAAWVAFFSAEALPGMKDSLASLAESALGKGAADTPAGRELMARVYFRALTTKKTAELPAHFEGLETQLQRRELAWDAALDATIDAIFSAPVAKTAEGFRFKAALLTKALESASDPRRLSETLDDFCFPTATAATKERLLVKFGADAFEKPETRRQILQYLADTLKSSRDPEDFAAQLEALPVPGKTPQASAPLPPPPVRDVDAWFEEKPTLLPKTSKWQKPTKKAAALAATKKELLPPDDKATVRAQTPAVVKTESASAVAGVALFATLPHEAIGHWPLAAQAAIYGTMALGGILGIGDFFRKIFPKRVVAASKPKDKAVPPTAVPAKGLAKDAAFRNAETAVIELPASQGEITIGRAASNTIAVDSAVISRQHARIVFDGDQLRIEDLRTNLAGAPESQGSFLLWGNVTDNRDGQAFVAASQIAKLTPGETWTFSPGQKIILGTVLLGVEKDGMRSIDLNDAHVFEIARTPAGSYQIGELNPRLSESGFAWEAGVGVNLSGLGKAKAPAETSPQTPTGLDAFLAPCLLDDPAALGNLAASDKSSPEALRGFLETVIPPVELKKIEFLLANTPASRREIEKVRAEIKSKMGGVYPDEKGIRKIALALLAERGFDLEGQLDASRKSMTDTYTRGALLSGAEAAFLERRAVIAQVTDLLSHLTLQMFPDDVPVYRSVKIGREGVANPDGRSDWGVGNRGYKTAQSYHGAGRVIVQSSFGELRRNGIVIVDTIAAVGNAISVHHDLGTGASSWVTIPTRKVAP